MPDPSFAEIEAEVETAFVAQVQLGDNGAGKLNDGPRHPVETSPLLGASVLLNQVGIKKWYNTPSVRTMHGAQLK